MIVLRFEQRARLLLGCLGSLFLMVACGRLGDVPDDLDLPVKKAGKTRTELNFGRVNVIDLSVGDVTYEIALTEGQALFVEADQQLADVTLELFSKKEHPQQQQLVAQAGLPTGRVTPEKLCFVAIESDVVRLRIATDKDVLGPTRLTVIRRAPKVEDSSCQDALQLAARAKAERSRSMWEAALLEAEKVGDLDFAQGIRLGSALGRLDKPAGEAFGPDQDVDVEVLVALEELLRRARLDRPDSESNWRRHIARLLIERSRLYLAQILIEGIEEYETTAADRAERFEILGRLALYRSQALPAERWFERAASAWRLTARPEQGAETWANWAASLAQQSRLEEAERILREGFALATDGTLAGRRALLLQRGWLSMLQNAPQRAIDAYRQGLDLMTSPGPSLEKAGFLARWASAEGMLGRVDQAKRRYKEALDQLPDPNGLWAAHIQKSLGDLEVEAGRFQQARDLLASAEEGFRAHGEENGQAHTWASLGWLERQAGKLSEAIDHFEKAAEIGDSIWLRAYQKGDLVRPTSLIFDIDAHLVDLLLAQAERDGASAPMRRAFVRSDQARARNLESLLQRAALGDGTQLFDQRTPYEPISTERLQQTVPDGTVLLSYVLGVDRSHLFALSKDDFRHHVLPMKDTLAPLADAWKHWLKRRRYSIQERNVAAELSRILLRPAQDLIRSANRLILVPEGLLGELPIEILPISETEVLNERREVLRGPSVGVLLQLTKRDRIRDASSGNIAVFADPVYSLSDPRCKDPCVRESTSEGSIDPAGTRRRPPRLPASGLEAEAIERWAPQKKSRIYLGFKAGLGTFEAEIRRRPSIIHLATHTHIDPSRPAQSGLWLSQYDTAGRETVGFLDIENIRNLQLDADLVVLSACESAWEEGVRGDGLVGFAQAFIQAGASKVLVSLWPVDDLPTALLMSELYRLHWSEDLTIRRALPKAQAHLRSMEQYRAPRYWAGFVLFGGWN